MALTPRIENAAEEARSGIVDRFGEWSGRHLHFASGFTLLALIESELVGFLTVREQVGEGLGDSTREAYVDMIEVVAEWRRRGVGRALVEACIDRARERGLCRVRAWSSDDKRAALAMWPVLGFELQRGVIISERTGGPVRGYFVTCQIADAST